MLKCYQCEREVDTKEPYFYLTEYLKNAAYKVYYFCSKECLQEWAKK